MCVYLLYTVIKTKIDIVSSHKGNDQIQTLKIRHTCTHTHTHTHPTLNTDLLIAEKMFNRISCTGAFGSNLYPSLLFRSLTHTVLCSVSLWWPYAVTTESER